MLKDNFVYLPLISSNIVTTHYLRVLKRLLNCYRVKYIVSSEKVCVHALWVIFKIE